MNGEGTDTSFGIVGALLSLLGCLAGNLFTVCYVIAREESIPLLDLLPRLNPKIIAGLMTATFSPMDILYYGIAIYEGYTLSFRQLSEDELAKLQVKGQQACSIGLSLFSILYPDTHRPELIRVRHF